MATLSPAHRIAATAHLADTDALTKVTAYAAARAALTIAADHTPGHDLDTVMARMTTSRALDTIRRAYTHRIHAGDSAKEAADKVGLRMVRAYRDHYGL